MEGEFNRSTLSKETEQVMSNYISDVECLSKTRLKAVAATVLFVVLGVGVYFFSSDKESIQGCCAMFGFLAAWSMALVIAVPYKLRDMRIRLYRMILEGNQEITFEEVAKRCNISQQRLQLDLDFCSRYCIVPKHCMEIAGKSEESIVEVSEDSKIIVWIYSLNDINNRIEDERLHSSVSSLIAALQGSEKNLNQGREEFLDTYITGLLSILTKYTELTNKIPAGYEDLIEIIRMVIISIEEFSAEDDFQKEIDFSTDVSSLLMFAQCAGLTSEKTTKFTNKKLENP